MNQEPTDRHWSVTVVVNGEPVLTIESECYGGLENATDYREEIITAAQNLLAFIGDGKEVGIGFDV